MKRITTYMLLVSVFFFVQSFADKNAASYSLTIDTAPFDAKADNNYTAQLTNSSKTVSVTFAGNEVRDKQGNTYPTKIQLDYTFKEGALGEVNVEKVTYEYNNHTYHCMPGTAFMSITKMKWNADKKSFAVCADIFCKVQQHYIMEEFVPVMVIRGNVQNLNVTTQVM